MILVTTVLLILGTMLLFLHWAQLHGQMQAMSTSDQATQRNAFPSDGIDDSSELASLVTNSTLGVKDHYLAFHPT